MFSKKNASNNTPKTITEDIEQLRERRENRKTKEEKKASTSLNAKEVIKPMDKEYAKMIRKNQAEIYKKPPYDHITGENSKIFVVVRKRPLSTKEITNGETDCVSCLNPKITIHECKIKVDGITKYLEDHEFYYDNTFSENDSTENLYDYSLAPMINFVLNKGIVTCFAYGQTGSGKTYTMKGIQNQAIDSLFDEAAKLSKSLVFYISFFEIYEGKLLDLLNNKNKLQVLDDKYGKVQIFGLQEVLTETPEDMRIMIDKGNSVRTTHNTVTNETSSRSHAICNIIIKEKNSEEEYGKLSLVDLAGSERAQETKSNNKQRRAEGAEINKSLLALKECIRALDVRKNVNADQHVPFRASKLTHVLRNSFVSKSNKSKIIMISCVNPSYCSANHSINTLRYSDRLKEQTSASIHKQRQNSTSTQNQRALTVPSSKATNDSNSNHTNHSNKPSNDSIKEIDDINSNVFNLHDDNLCDMNFDDKVEFNKDALLLLSPNSKDNNPKEGKHISDDFIRYHQLTDLILEEEDDLINTHVEVIKDNARMLTVEGELIAKIKHIATNEFIDINEYIERLEKMVDDKIDIYSNLQDKLELYNTHVQEETNMRHDHPNFFIENTKV